jgi:F0F1-type ATP synthase assembly protein I
MSTNTTQRLLLEGVTDAVGFIGGALLGYGIGHLLGWDIFAEGYGSTTIGAILLVGLGGGMGRAAARRWRMARSATASKE